METYGFDANIRLSSLTHTVSGGSNAITLGYTAADQIKSRTQSNAAYAVAGPSTAGTTSYANNGLNRITSVNGGTAFGYDGRGNLTSDGSGASYGYNVNNLLTSATQAGVTSTLAYDAENRLYSVTKSGVTTKFLYDGTDLIAEYNSSNALLRRYVHGPGSDNPLVWYEGATTTPKYYLYSDERGSITAVTSSTGGVNTVYGYTEYGVPSTLSGALSSRFRYTGQTWLSEVGLYYYKARMYAPSLGRFLQTDPIGYGDGMNMYAYVGNDPINGTDPSGLAENYTCTQHHWVGRITSSSDPSRVGKIAWDDGLMTSCTSSGASGAQGMWDGFQNRDDRQTDDSTLVLVTGTKKSAAVKKVDEVKIVQNNPSQNGSRWVEGRDSELDEINDDEARRLATPQRDDSYECTVARNHLKASALALYGVGIGTMAVSRQLGRQMKRGRFAGPLAMGVSDLAATWAVFNDMADVKHYCKN